MVGRPIGSAHRRVACAALILACATAVGTSSAAATPPSVGGTLDLAQSDGRYAGARQSTPMAYTFIGEGYSPDAYPASVAFVGDVNGDGVPDAAVGSPLADFAGRIRAGTVSVIFGNRPPQAKLDLANLGEAGLVIGGPAMSARTGTSVAGLGDVDGDGYGDLLVGAPRASIPGRGRSAGTAFVVFGGPGAATIDLAASGGRAVPILGRTHGDHAGMAVAAVPDLDGDGRAEAVVGAPDADPDGRDRGGSVYVVASGRLSTGADLAFPAQVAFRIDGPAAASRLGAAVASTGDMNGDGLAEVLAGAPGVPEGGGPAAPLSGAYVVWGRPPGATVDLAAGDAAALPLTAPASERAGAAVADAGDVDADGVTDVVVGAPSAAAPGRRGAGAAYVIHGRADPTPVALTADALRIDGARAGDRLGVSVAGAGDVDGDGRADVVVGAPSAGAFARSAQSGAAYLVLAAPLDLAVPGVAALRMAGTDGSEAGASVAGGTDVDGDRRADVLVGSYPGSADLVLSPTAPAPVPRARPASTSCAAPRTNIELMIADTVTLRGDWEQLRAALELLLVRPRALPTTFGLLDVGDRGTQVIAPMTVGPEGFTGSLELLRALLAEPSWEGGTRRLSAGFAASAATNPGRQAQVLVTDGASSPGPDPSAAEVGVPTYVIGLGVGADSADGRRLADLAGRSGGRFFAAVDAAALPGTIAATAAALACEVPVPAAVTDISPQGEVVGAAAAGQAVNAPVVALPPGGAATLTSDTVQAPRGVTFSVTGTWRDATTRFGIRSIDLVRGERPAIHVPQSVLRRAASRRGTTYRSLQLRLRTGRRFFVVRLRVPAAVAGGGAARAAQSGAHSSSLDMNARIYRPAKKTKKKKPKSRRAAATALAGAAQAPPRVRVDRRLVAVRITRSAHRRP